MVNLDSPHSEILLAAGETPPSSFDRVLREFPGLYWFSTSGTTSRHWVGLSKTGFRASAEAVCAHFDVSARDNWCLCLPEHHVGGFAIRVRASVCGCRVTQMQGAWSALRLHQLLVESGATLVSLVPTQVHDLVVAGLEAPPKLRTVIVGGAELSSELWEQARHFHWHLVPTYGLTEASSQVAVQELGRTEYEVLPHIEVRISPEGRLQIAGSSVARYMITTANQDPEQACVQGWYSTGDLADVRVDGERRYLTLKGRADRQVKIVGELVSLDSLEAELSRFLAMKLIQIPLFAIVAVPEPRRGMELQLFYDSSHHQEGLSLQEINSALGSLKRISKLIPVSPFPRLANGKRDLKSLSALCERST